MKSMDEQKDRDNRRSEFESLLGRATAGPPADPRFRDDLRRTLVQAHPASTSRPLATSRRSGRRRAPGWLGPAAVLTAAAVVAAIILVPRLGLGPWRLAEFGPLPELAASTKPGEGAGGPGFTFDLSYTLGGSLAAGWPDLPGRALAYRLRPPVVTEARARELATGLGITASVVQEGWQDGFLWAADPGDGGPALRVFPDGYTYFSQPYDFGPRERGRLPSAERAVAAARDWLTARGFVPAGELGAGRVTEDLENGTLLVKFGPADPADVVTISPFAVVQLGEGEKVVMGSATWYPGEAASRYPLREVADAWEAVRSGRGVLAWQLREYPGPASDTGVVIGQVTIDRVRVAWAAAFAADGTPYFVPVYAFSGQAVVPSSQGPVTLPVEVWVPAVTDEYGGN